MISMTNFNVGCSWKSNWATVTASHYFEVWRTIEKEEDEKMVYGTK